MQTDERSQQRRRSRIGGVVFAVLVAIAGAVVPASTSTAFVGRASSSRSLVAFPRLDRAPQAIPHVIIDTDLSRWWDDATAIGIANVLQQQRKVQVLGIVSDVPNHVAVAAIDAINTAYGHLDIPIGAVTNSASDTFTHGYTDELVRRLPHSVRNSDDVPNAVTLYRQLLERAPNNSVTIISLGGYTNLAGLMATPGDRHTPSGHALITQKVKRLVIMDGLFPNGGPAFTNQRIDLAAAATVVGGPGQPGWPGPIAWVDGFSGLSTRVGGALCSTTAPQHPMRIVYEFLFACGPVHDGNWDAPTLLFAIGDIPGAFSALGHGGAAVINASGGLSWQDNSPRPFDFYLHIADQALLNQRIEQLLPLGAPAPCESRPTWRAAGSGNCAPLGRTMS
jgi:Inosine-uridine preferring nucleoside hydrolase